MNMAMGINEYGRAGERIQINTVMNIMAYIDRL